MRKIYILLFILGCRLLLAQVPTNGLIGAWPFSGNANDISGTGNNGTVFGATLTADRCGNPNSAYSFNGTSDYIQMLLTGPTGTLSRSISFWARTTNTVINNARATFDYGTALGAGDSYQVVWNYCGAGVGLDLSNQALIRGNSCLLNNVWHHIVAVYNSTLGTVYSNVSYYIDGVLQPVIQCNVSGTTANINTGSAFPITIGRGATSALRYWLGDLDDFYLYDRPLTPAEVAQLYTPCQPPVYGNTLVCTGSTNVYSIAPISNATYTWTLPGGWSGTSTTNTISAVVGNTGTISVAASSTCGSFGTSSLAVTTITLPVLNLSSTTASLCAGKSATLTAIGANAYTWTPGGQNTSSVVVSPLVTTNYTVRGTSTLTGCSSSTVISQLVSSNPVLFANSSGSLPCTASSATITAFGAVTYSWLPGASTGSSTVVSPSLNTTYTVTGANLAGCTGSTSLLVAVPSAMTLNIAASAASVCPGNNITFTASNAGGTAPYTYTWSGGPNTSTYAASMPGGAGYVFTVSSRNANNCLVTNTISGYFFANPILSASDQSVCPGLTTFTVTGASTYTWLPVGSTGNTFTVFSTSPASYTVTGTSVNGCTASTTASVALKPVPSLSFLTASITCASLGSATVNATAGVGPYSYSWTPTAQTSNIAVNLYPGTYTLSVFDNGTGCTSLSNTTFNSLVPFTGTVASTSSLTCNGINTGTASIALSGGSGIQSYAWSNATGTQTTAVATLLSAGQHTVVVTDAVTFCTVTETFLITQPPPVTVNVTSSATMACVNSSIIIAALNFGGTAPHSYTWTGFAPSNFVSTTKSIGGTYLYFVNSKDANNCPGTGSISLVFTDYPSLTVNSPTMCVGGLATLSVSGAQSYSWFPGGFTTNTLNVFPPSTAIYTIVGGTLGCKTTSLTQVTVYPLPIPAIVSGNNICETQPIVLNATGGTTYSWTGPNGFSSVSQNTFVTSASMSSAGSYSLRVTDANGCSAGTTTLITVLLNPIPSASGASVCLGEPATLQASGGVLYQWSGPGGFSANGQQVFIPVVNSSNAGSYTVNVTGSNSCLAGKVVQLVAYPYPLPVPSITATPKACLNSPVSMQASGGLTYLWTGPGNLSSTSPTLNFTPDNYNLSGIYTLTVRNGSNCAASTTVSLKIYPLPVATIISSKNKMCVPFCSKFRIVAINNGAAPIKGFYFVNSAGVFSDSTITSCFTYPEDRLLKVNYVDTNNCVNSATLLINAYPKPVADFEFSPAEPQAAMDAVTFTNLSNTTPQSDWHWYFENDSAAVKEKDPSHVFSLPNTFPVVLIVKNSWGCSDTIIKPVVVSDDISLYVPDVFTPNADGLNDVFQPKGVGIAKYSLEIFDRWGHKLFSTADFFKPWDGTFKGELCKVDTYIWMIRVTGNTGKEKRFQGHVTILK